MCIRDSVEGQPTIDAVADNVTETTRGTVLSKNGVKVSTIEHGMAAVSYTHLDVYKRQPIITRSFRFITEKVSIFAKIKQAL